MGKKQTLENNLIENTKYKLDSEIINLIKQFINERKSLTNIAQITNKLSDNLNNFYYEDLINFVLNKCFEDLKNNQSENSYYYLSVLYFFKETFPIDNLTNFNLKVYKSELKPKNTKNKIILNELNHLFDKNAKRKKTTDILYKYDINPNEKKDKTHKLPENLILLPTSTPSIKAFTIDPSENESLKDDAVSIREINNVYKLGIHISDTSNFLKENLELEKYAENKLLTIYLSDRIIHMIPEQLSRKYLSLEKGKHRNVISLYLTIDKQGNIIERNFRNETIEIEFNLSYKDAEMILKNEIKVNSELDRKIKLLDHVSYLLENRCPKVDYCCDITDNDENHRTSCIIQTMMVTFNENMAKFMSKKDIPFIFRVQKEPTILELSDTKSNICLYNEAYYSLENIGHYSMDRTHYCHSTAGIRRYMDNLSQKLFNLTFNNLSVNELRELEKNIINLVEYANKKERELRYFIPEYELCYHNNFKS